MKEAAENKKAGRVALFGLAALIFYVVVLALAAVSEWFDLGWFNQPIFK